MHTEILEQILSEVTGLKSEMAVIKHDIAGMKSDISDMKNEIADVKSEMADMKGEIADVKNEMADMKSEIAHLQQQTSENTQLIKAILHRQEESDAKLENLTIHVEKLHDEMSSMRKDITGIKNEIEYTYQKTSKNELEIFKLRKQAE